MAADDRQQRIDGFLGEKGMPGARRECIAGDASFRRYERVWHASETYILMDAPPEKEDVRPFLAIQSYYREQAFNVPSVVAEDAQAGFLLLEDLGDDSFTRILQADPSREEELYHAAIDVLVQVEKQGMNALLGREVPLYDWPLLEREVMLFAEWFLPMLKGKEQAEQLAESWRQVFRDLFAATPLPPQGLVHRDFHADNLFWLSQGAVGMLDFQDAVLGRMAYDVVSLLEDARRDVSPQVVASSLERFIEAAGCDHEAFMQEYALFGAQRNAKILGIFTRLYLRDGKPRYLELIPRVWRHIMHDLTHPALLPVKEWMDAHISDSERDSILHANLKDMADHAAA